MLTEMSKEARKQLVDKLFADIQEKRENLKAGQGSEPARRVGRPRLSDEERKARQEERKRKAREKYSQQREMLIAAGLRQPKRGRPKTKVPVSLLTRIKVEKEVKEAYEAKGGDAWLLSLLQRDT